MSGLALGNEQALAFPIDVIEGQRGDLPGAKSVGDEQKQHCEVALAERTTTVHALEHQSDVVATDRPRHAGQAVHAWRLDRPGQVARDRAFPVGIAHQHPHRTAHSSHAGLAHTRAGLGHEGAENGRGEFGEALHTDANQKGFEDSKVVTVVAYRCLAQTSFLTQGREEARCLGQERIACDSCPTPSHKRRDYKGDELFDRAPRALPTTASASSAATGFSPCRPVGNKGLDVLGELFEGPGTTTPCELCELPQNRNPWPDIARRIALARQRRDVAFDGLGEPTATDLVDGLGLEEILFQHDNLLSSGWERRSSRIEGHSLCAPGRALLLRIPHVGRPRPHHPERHISSMMFRGTSSNSICRTPPPSTENASTWPRTRLASEALR